MHPVVKCILNPLEPAAIVIADRVAQIACRKNVAHTLHIEPNRNGADVDDDEVDGY